MGNTSSDKDSNRPIDITMSLDQSNVSLMGKTSDLDPIDDRQVHHTVPSLTSFPFNPFARTFSIQSAGQQYVGIKPIGSPLSIQDNSKFTNRWKLLGKPGNHVTTLPVI